MHHSDGDHRQILLAQPLPAARGIHQAYGDERPVDHAVERIEHPQPGQRCERHRHRPRQHDERAGNSTAWEFLHQQHGGKFAEQESDDLGSDGEDERIDQCSLKDAAVDHIDEILQPDELIVRIENREGADAVIDGEEERQRDQNKDIEDCWSDEERADQLGTVEQEAGFRPRRIDCDCGHGASPPRYGCWVLRPSRSK